jgi:hypothetical protein
MFAEQEVKDGNRLKRRLNIWIFVAVIYSLGNMWVYWFKPISDIARDQNVHWYAFRDFPGFFFNNTHPYLMAINILIVLCGPILTWFEIQRVERRANAKVVEGLRIEDQMRQSVP